MVASIHVTAELGGATLHEMTHYLALLEEYWIRSAIPCAIRADNVRDLHGKPGRGGNPERRFALCALQASTFMKHR